MKLKLTGQSTELNWPGEDLKNPEQSAALLLQTAIG